MLLTAMWSASTMSIEVLEKGFIKTYRRNSHSKGKKQSGKGEKVNLHNENGSVRQISDNLADMVPTTPSPPDVKDYDESKTFSYIIIDDDDDDDDECMGLDSLGVKEELKEQVDANVDRCDRSTGQSIREEDAPALHRSEEKLREVVNDKDSGSRKRRLGWFCVNCTVLNADEAIFCDACREHRNSGILKSGFLAPAHLPGHLPSAINISQGGCSVQGSPVSARSLIHVLSPLPIFSSRPIARLTAIGYDDRMLLHSEDQIKAHPHPERPDRLRSIMAGLASSGLFPGQCFTIPPREATREELERVHSQRHIDDVEMSSSKELTYFTADTYANKHSALAARLAAGICADLATAVMKGQAQNGFALVRPPGHHAEESTVIGFCLYNNAAMAAKAALAAGAKKVLIVDWDVHHGNGTQDIFELDPSVLYISLHRYENGKFYPGSGAADEPCFCLENSKMIHLVSTPDGLLSSGVSLHAYSPSPAVGSEKGEGYSVNIPWSVPGIGDEDYLFAFQHIVLPVAKQFQPDITIVSAGFDAAMGDPLGGCEVTPFGYAQMTQMLSTLAEGRMVVVLEGGYNLRSISASATAVIKVLLGECPGNVPEHLAPSRAGLDAVVEACRVQSRYWTGLVVPNWTTQKEHHGTNIKEGAK